MSDSFAESFLKLNFTASFIVNSFHFKIPPSTSSPNNEHFCIIERQFLHRIQFSMQPAQHVTEVFLGL